MDASNNKNDFYQDLHTEADLEMIGGIKKCDVKDTRISHVYQVAYNFVVFQKWKGLRIKKWYQKVLKTFVLLFKLTIFSKVKPLNGFEKDVILKLNCVCDVNLRVLIRLKPTKKVTVFPTLLNWLSNRVTCYYIL